jgi:nucleoside-diphosphate-sugar epimerase
MCKILITGGSGFIGTNLVELLLSMNYSVVNYDIKKPKIEGHIKFWKKIDLCNSSQLLNELSVDCPKYIIHLAARTDLNETLHLEGYDVNIKGVRNLMNGVSKIPNFKRIIIASSMLVCRLGYNPISFDDYAPNNLYGESKVLTEKIVKDYDFNWTIVRPTSIWGPWFGEPYKNFFNLVIKGLYFNIPSQYSSTKTYGYVDNTCRQIFRLLMNDDEEVNHNYYYLGDLEPINITDWAIRIRKLNNQSPPLTLSISLLKFAATTGDLFKRVFANSKFPMNTFRYNNMTQDNIIEDLRRTVEITQCGKDSNLDKQILQTLNWLKQHK